MYLQLDKNRPGGQFFGEQVPRLTPAQIVERQAGLANKADQSKLSCRNDYRLRAANNSSNVEAIRSMS
jgi:hypothetical protein